MWWVPFKYAWRYQSSVHDVYQSSLYGEYHVFISHDTHAVIIHNLHNRTSYKHAHICIPKGPRSSKKNDKKSHLAKFVPPFISLHGPK